MPTDRRTRRVSDCWFVYMLRTRTGSLYTGIARDVAVRIATHAAGAGAKSLRGRGPLRLAFSARVGARGAALSVECRIKRLRKLDKERLVADPAFAAACCAPLDRRATRP
jgi:putative endonuclease